MTVEHQIVQEPHLHSELLQIWSKLLSSPTLSIDDDFFESGGDLLLATEMLLEIERRFGKSVPHSLLFEASTINRLATLLSNSSELQPKAVVQSTDFGKQTSLLFFHGDWRDGGFFVKKLSRALGTEQPITLISPHGLDWERIPSKIKEMAADRLPRILAVQPRGPYRLAGHCVGGMVALETARLLVEGGHQVEVVAMIDSPWPAAVPDKNYDNRERQYFKALRSYSPAPLSVPLVVFSSEWDGVPWRTISSDFTLFQLRGGHHDWVMDRSDLFAALLKARLEIPDVSAEPKQPRVLRTLPGLLVSRVWRRLLGLLGIRR